jgi:hypothetical protein
MKNLIVVSMLAGIALLSVSCGSTKKVAIEKQSGTEEVILPLSGKDFQSDKEYYRTKSSGKSPDIATAKKIALNNSKAEIAGLISAKLKAVTDNYTNQRSTANAQDFENKFETMSREVVNQQLVDVTIIGEKLLKNGNSYEYWIAIEVSKQAILNGIENTISKNQKLQIDYDKKKFEEVYNQEMSKLENEGK